MVAQQNRRPTMLGTTLLTAATIATAAVMSNNVAAGRAATPSAVPTITAVETATIRQALSTGILRLNIVTTAEPMMAIRLTGGILLGKHWSLIGQRSYEVCYPTLNGKRVHLVVNIPLSKHGLELLMGRKSAKLRFLTWCADEPDKTNKLVVRLNR
jgi:hypothetical protein